jgi:hypothetical protein
MSARRVIEHALRVYYADSRNPQNLVDGLLASYDAERVIPPLWVADYDSAPLTLHLTREAARAACDDVAKVDAHGKCWDWRTEDGDTDRQFWTHEDDDRPTGYTGGTVWQITVEGGEKDTRGEPSPQQGESTHPAPRPGVLPVDSFTRARKRSAVAAFFRCAGYGHDEAPSMRDSA